MSKISILIPVYNVRNYILRCLESVASQTFTGTIECIIVDDCGTDGSIEIAEKFVSEYKGVIEFRILHHEHNRGLAAARNTAVSAATGDFVFHLDSDDWLESIAIEHLIRLQRETNADIVSGNALRHSTEGDNIMVEPNYVSSIDMVHNTIEMTLDHVIWRRLIRRSLYVANRIEASEGVNIGEDHHTMPRLAYYAKKIATLDEIVYHYNCMNPFSYMTQQTKKFNIRKYRGDLASINILENFFSDKDSYCVRRLQEIKEYFFSTRLQSACQNKDRNAYYEITKDAGIVSFYFYARFKHIMHKLLNIVIGFSK